MNHPPRVPTILEMAVRAAHEPLAVLSLDGRVLLVNDACSGLLDVDGEASIGQHLCTCAPSWDQSALRSFLEDQLPEEQIVDGFQIERRTAFETRRLEINARVSESDRVMLLSMADVTERAPEDVGKRNRVLEVRERRLSRRVLELTREVRQIEQEERRRIAEMLHDDLQQRLYGVGMQAALARRAVETRRYDTAVETLLRAEEWLDECTSVLRSLAAELSPPVLMAGGFASTMEWLSARVHELHGLEVDVHVDDGVTMGNETRELLSKVARELLFNVVKHSGVSRAAARVRMSGPYVELTVSDRGQGFDPLRVLSTRRKPTGLGLFRLEELVRGLGGTFSIRSTSEEGTQVTVRLPAHPEQ